MKSVLLIRHAKSSWDSPTGQDFDRPLNERGHKDAQIMAQRLQHQKITIDAFVSSTAQRAFTTAEYFHTTFKAPPSNFILKPELYHAPPSVFYEVIAALDDAWTSTAIFSHNPGITEMVNSLAVASVSDMPTCGIFGVTADIKSWKDFSAAEKRFLLFDYPKNDKS